MTTPDVARAVRLARSTEPVRAGRSYAVTKRVLDVVVSTVLLVSAAPLLVLVALMVRVTSRGPVLFRQTRVGLHGAPFTMLKFRTMRIGCDDIAHREYVHRLLSESDPGDGGAPGVYKLVNDPRVTAVGRVLRSTSLDELPQLLNVLRGEMSLVGPRPALAWEVEQYEARHRRRLLVQPGVTGLWQVSGRSALTMRQALELDLEYVERRRLALDLTILLLTVPALLGRSSAA